MAQYPLDASTLHTVLGHAPAFIYVVDRDFNCLYMNRFQAPYTLEDVIGEPMEKYFTPDVAEFVFKFYDKVFDTGEDQNLEYFIDFPDGVRRWYYTALSALRDSSGEVTAIVCVTTETTEKKKIEEQHKQMQSDLVEASRRAGMTEVVTGVLHNIGNVLNSINVSAGMAVEQLGSSHLDMLIRAIKLMEEQGDDLPAFLASDPRGRKLPALMSRLGEQLMAVNTTARGELKRLMEQIELIRSTIDAQQSVARPRQVLEESSLGELVEKALSLFRIECDLKGIERSISAEGSTRVMLDRQATLQILLNLIRNAIEALLETHGTRKFEVKAYTSDDSVYFEISDNGCGISEENLVKIFNHGFTTKPHGHGFGLHSSAIAAQSMGGSLKATSEGPGRGAQFCLTLPKQLPPRGNFHVPPPPS
jgi:PAS domain S-box-containing protein